MSLAKVGHVSKVGRYLLFIQNRQNRHNNKNTLTDNEIRILIGYVVAGLDWRTSESAKLTSISLSFSRPQTGPTSERKSGSARSDFFAITCYHRTPHTIVLLI